MKCAVLGDPVAHSLSPALHRAAYDALGLSGWSYEAIQVPAGTLAEFLDELDTSWRGLSLTAPLKREVVPLLDSNDEWVARTGVANTLLVEGTGRRHGMNTDVPGAVAALREHVAGPLTHAVVLGAGATAVSMVVALREFGLERATLLAREPRRTGETVRAITSGVGSAEVRVQPLAEAAARVFAADIVVSTVPASAQSTALVAAVAEVPVVFDVVYDSWPTPLAAAGAASGRTVVSGLDLLIGQAAFQVAAMTGVPEAPLAPMRAAAEQELSRRGLG